MTDRDDARDIVARCEDALKRRDMLLEHKLLQELVRAHTATRAERDALRDPWQVWRGIQAIDNIVTAHRAAGDTFVTIRLEFERREDK